MSKRTHSRFSLRCGCKDSTAVSPDKSPPGTTATKTSGTTATDTQPTSTSFSLSDAGDDTSSAAAAPTSFSGLLRQLTELQKNVLEWAPPIQEEKVAEAWAPPPHAAAVRSQHRRCRSEGGGRLEESVVVVKESDDPLGDFRRSMLQMIVENEIVDGDELGELLRKFLQLNSRRHHDVILRAFSEIWSEVFAGYEDTPDLLRRSRSNYIPRRI